MKYYPRHVICQDGATRIVADHIQHSRLTGIEYGPDAQPISYQPPSLETVLAAGYSHKAAEGIVADEQAKQEQGIEPYGSVPLSQFVATEPATAVQPESPAAPLDMTEAAPQIDKPAEPLPEEPPLFKRRGKK